jgi:hypothetical protein
MYSDHEVGGKVQFEVENQLGTVPGKRADEESKVDWVQEPTVVTYKVGMEVNFVMADGPGLVQPGLMRLLFSAEFAPGPVSRKPLLRQVTGFVEEVRQYRLLAEKK